MMTRAKDNTRQLNFFPDFIALHATTELDPTTFNQADKSPQWRAAMSDELNALAKNNTWTLVSPPTDEKIIGCK
jgi:hypothetical protein